MKKVRNLVTNHYIQSKALGCLPKIRALGRLRTAFGQNQASVAVADFSLPVHEMCPEAGNEAGHDLHDIHNTHQIHEIHDIHNINDIHGIHDNCNIQEISNTGHYTPDCSQHKGIVLCVKSLPKNTVTYDDSGLSLENCLVSVVSHSVSSGRSSSSINSIDSELDLGMTHFVNVDVHSSNV